MTDRNRGLFGRGTYTTPVIRVCHISTAIVCAGRHALRMHDTSRRRPLLALISCVHRRLLVN